MKTKKVAQGRCRALEPDPCTQGITGREIDKSSQSPTSTASTGGGFVKFRREWEPLLQDPEITVIWLACLLRASFKPSTFFVHGQAVKLEIGEFVFGRGAWSARLNISDQKLRKRMDTLKKMGLISTSRRTSKFTVYKVVNSDTYQSPRSGEQPADNQQTTSRRTTIKEGEKEKKEKDYDYPHAAHAHEERRPSSSWEEEINENKDLEPEVRAYIISSAKKNGKNPAAYAHGLVQRAREGTLRVPPPPAEARPPEESQEEKIRESWKILSEAGYLDDLKKSVGLKNIAEVDDLLRRIAVGDGAAVAAVAPLFYQAEKIRRYFGSLPQNNPAEQSYTQ